MKRLISATVAICIFLSFIIQAFCVSVDGFDNGAEWDGASVQLLENGNSNCKITFAAVKYSIASAENAIYLCFMFTDPDAEEFNPAAGVTLTVGNDTFTVTMDNSPCADDTIDHSFDAAITADKNHGMTCEVRIGVKSGIPQSVDFSVRFADTVGELSSIYNFSVVNPNYTVPQENVYVPLPNHGETYPEEKTTKVKKTTTQKTTVLKETTKKKKPTTTRKQKTTCVKTTSPHTTKSKVKTTKSAVKATGKRTESFQTEQAATVYYYEKEVIISQVIVTVPAVTETTESKFERIGGAKVKIFLLALGFLLILIIAAAGALGKKNEIPQSKKSESEESQNSEIKEE